MLTSSWSPVFDVSIRENIIKKIHEIGRVLNGIDPEMNDTGLLSGETGIWLFLFYYSKVFDRSNILPHNVSLHLERIIQRQNSNTAYSFSSGLGGLAWLLSFLSKHQLIAIKSEEIFEEIEDYLYEKMILEMKNGHYDFLHASLGIGMFFLSEHDNIKYRNYLSNLIDELENRGVRFNNNEITWESVLSYQDGKVGYNLGLAHGMASIISFLSKAYQYGINEKKTFRLLNESINYVFGNTFDINNSKSYFPNWICKQEETPSSSRLGWCYGDLGIANSLWLASQAMKNEDLEKKSIEIFLHSTKRKDGIHDAGLCHGAIGVAHIYNRMYHRTNIELFKDSSILWYTTALRMDRFETGPAGYKCSRPDGMDWVDSYTLLEGIAGIGLGLIFSITDIEPHWDECLLLS